MPDCTNEEYHYHHDWTHSEAISVTVIQALNDVLDTPTEELPALRDIVPPDAVDTVLSPTAPDGTARRGDCRLTFEYDAYLVTIHRDGEIIIHQSEDSPER